MKPELTAAVRAGAVNLAEQLVAEERAEAYSLGVASASMHTEVARANRDQWRSFAYETKDKLVEMARVQAEMNKRFERLRVETESAKPWTNLMDAWDEGWQDAMTMVGQILDGVADDEIGPL